MERLHCSCIKLFKENNSVNKRTIFGDMELAECSFYKYEIWLWQKKGQNENHCQKLIWKRTNVSEF